MIISKQKSTVVLSGLVLAIGMTLSGLIQAVIPEKVCVQSMNPPLYASQQELIDALAKDLKGKVPEVSVARAAKKSAMAHYAEYPEDFEPSARRESIRLRAALYHLDKGKTTSKGDLYLEHYTKIGHLGGCDRVTTARGKCTKIKKFFCLNTSDFTKALKARGESQDGHYLTAVRVEVRNSTSCFLPDDRSIHSWMTAPRKGTLKFKIYGDEPCRQI